MCVCELLPFSGLKVPRHLLYVSCLCVWDERPAASIPNKHLLPTAFSDGDSALLSFTLSLRCVFPAEMSEWSSEREGGTRGEEEEKFQAAEEKPDTQETRSPMKASL